jgi:hypothetical protein
MAYCCACILARAVEHWKEVVLYISLPNSRSLDVNSEVEAAASGLRWVLRRRRGAQPEPGFSIAFSHDG